MDASSMSNLANLSESPQQFQADALLQPSIQQIAASQQQQAQIALDVAEQRTSMTQSSLSRVVANVVFISADAQLDTYI